MMTSSAELAVVYDFLQVRGGAERVSLTLARDLPARLLIHGRAADFDVDENIDAQEVEALSGNALVRAWRAWHSFAELPAQPGVAGVVLSGHYGPLSWRAFPRARRILYLHAMPLAFASEPGLEHMFRLPSFPQAILRAAVFRLKRSYVCAVREMDFVFANSSRIATAFEAVTGRRAVVLSPPVDDRFFECGRPHEGYWISLARHEPVKRVERVLKAFLGLPRVPLVIAGSGSQTPMLRKLARGSTNITFAGSLDTLQLTQLLGGSVGSIHVSEREPFGLAIVESLAAGKPVVAARGNGAESFLADQSNALLLESDPSPDAIRNAVQAIHYGSLTLSSTEAISKSVGTLRSAAFVEAVRSTLVDGA